MAPITVGRIGTGLITTIITVPPSTGATGGPMAMCSGITITAGSIMILAGEGSRAAALRVVSMGDFTEEADFLMGAVASMEGEAAVMADDRQTAEIL